MRRYKKKSIVVTYPSGRQETKRTLNRVDEKEKLGDLNKARDAGILTYTITEDK